MKDHIIASPLTVLHESLGEGPRKKYEKCRLASKSPGWWGIVKELSFFKDSRILWNKEGGQSMLERVSCRMFAALVCLSLIDTNVSAAPPTISYIDAQGREWAQVALFTNLSWNDVNAVCPSGDCDVGNGAQLNGYDVDGWTWASVYDVSDLFQELIPSFPGGITAIFEASSTWAPYISTVFSPTDVTIAPYYLRGSTSTLKDPANGYSPFIRDQSGALNDEANTFASSPIATAYSYQGAWFYRVVSTAVELSCEGFEAPVLDKAVKVKKNRTLPFKASLVDDALQYVDDLFLTAPPVIQISFTDGIAPAIDVSDDALSSGAGTDGNQFEFVDDQWQFNLQTKNYSAVGTYTVRMISGDDSEYVINPTCVGTFVIE